MMHTALGTNTGGSEEDWAEDVYGSILLPPGEARCQRGQSLADWREGSGGRSDPLRVE